jgi:hypothetical protein
VLQASIRISGTRITIVISILLILSIKSGCVDQENTIMGSGVASKIALSEKSWQNNFHTLQ